MKNIKLKMFLSALILSGNLLAQKKVQSFEVDRVIPRSAESVWKVVGDDFGAIANSHPNIVSSNYVNGTLKSGEGAERRCNLNDSGSKYIEEKQINFQVYNPFCHTFNKLKHR